MTHQPKPGETWIDPTPATDRGGLDPTRYRRCVTVASVGDRYVEGTSFWQERADEDSEWFDKSHAFRRPATIPADTFAQRFVLAARRRCVLNRNPHPIVTVILGALQAEAANVEVSRVATGRLDVDLTLRSIDGRRVIVNIKEQD